VLDRRLGSFLFQSLDWVERLSDSGITPGTSTFVWFQSLDWVERLSDISFQPSARAASTFQSLDWVERLSDWQRHIHFTQFDSCFNPSTGLSVFQTRAHRNSSRRRKSFNPSTGLSVFQTADVGFRLNNPVWFQSLDWVERLSDGATSITSASSPMFQSLDWVERLSDSAGSPAAASARRRFNPSTGLSVFQTDLRRPRRACRAVSIPRLG